MKKKIADYCDLYRPNERPFVIRYRRNVDILLNANMSEIVTIYFRHVNNSVLICDGNVWFGIYHSGWFKLRYL